MAYLVTTILIQLDDVLVKGDKAQQGRLQDITEQAIQNRLFGHGFLPEDAEVGSWEVQHTWVEDAARLLRSYAKTKRVDWAKAMRARTMMPKQRSEA